MRKAVLGMAVVAFAVGLAGGWFARVQLGGQAGDAPARRPSFGEAPREEAVAQTDARRKVETPRTEFREEEEGSGEDRLEIEALRGEVERLEGEIAALSEPEDPSEGRGYISEGYQKAGILSVADFKEKRPAMFKMTTENIGRQIDVLTRAGGDFDDFVGELDFSLLPESGLDTHERFVGHLRDVGERFSRANAGFADGTTLHKTVVDDILGAMESRERASDLAHDEASALVWLAAWKRAKEMGFSDEAAAGVAEAIGAILEATSSDRF